MLMPLTHVTNVITWVFLMLSAPIVSSANEPQYDVIISGGTVYDGSGSAPYQADLAILGDRIAAIGDLEDATTASRIDASGKAVSPGFINMLSWGVKSLIDDGRGVSDLTQGITLEVFGEGHSMGPVNDKTLEELNNAFQIGDPDWATLGGYLEYLENKGVSPNIASFIGATTARIFVLGQDNVKPNAQQLEAMQELVRSAMKEGAMGVASALIYTPGAFATTDELIALASAAGEHGGIYASHIRGEGEALLDSVEELIAIARTAGVPAEIYHLKAAHPAVWGQFPRVVERIEEARAEGLEITADIYPYAAGSTGLDAIFPPWAREGGYQSWVDRIQNPATRERILQEMPHPSDEWENMYAAVGPGKILLVDFRNPDLRKYTGMTLAEAAREMGVPAEVAAMNLVAADGSRVGAIYFTQSEKVVRQAAVLPWVSFCTDTETVAAEGEVLANSIHPRGYGSFPRILGKFVREENLMPLREAVRKASSLPARNLGIRERGALKTGHFADVLVFDPETIDDRATFESPHRYSEGMEHVFVNGVQVIADGEHTGATPGRVVRGPGWTGWGE